jgi:hypothetical protein
MLPKILGPGLSLILFAAAVWLLHNELRTYNLKDILHAFDAIPGSHLWAAARASVRGMEFFIATILWVVAEPIRSMFSFMVTGTP